jgi:hypothetical protein
MVQQAVADGVPSDRLTLDRLQRAAASVLGRSVAFGEAQFRRALDAEQFIRTRTGLGGVAPDATAAVLDACETNLHEDEAYHAACVRRLDDAQAMRQAAVAARIGPAGVSMRP